MVGFPVFLDRTGSPRYFTSQSSIVCYGSSPLQQGQSAMYEPRTYRHWVKDSDLISFDVTIKETDLRIHASRNLKRKALKSIGKYRDNIERYIERHPSFLTTLQPFSVDEDAPRIVREMARAAETASLGPMASVAGAIAESVGKDLLPFSKDVIVENGGDIFLKSTRKRTIGIFAGNSPLSGRVALEIEPEETPLGICTSSGTVGHSLSMGNADAVIVLARQTVLADAVATAVGNLVERIGDIEKGIEFIQNTEHIKGVVIIKDDRMGLWGDVKITRS